MLRAQRTVTGGRHGHGGVGVGAWSNLHAAVPSDAQQLFPDAMPAMASQWAVQWVRFDSVGSLPRQPTSWLGWAFGGWT
eukprot:6325064-Pyramimonas_sp.AAC.1